MDSNGKAFENLDVPQHIQIFSLAGAKIGDIPQTLKNSEQKLANVTKLVIGVGVNNRLDLDTSNTLQDLREIKDWGNQHKKEIAWLGIPNYTALPAEALSNIKTMNKMACDIFRDKYITTLDPWEIHISPQDKHKIHYNEESAKIILDLMVDFLGV